VERIIFPDSCTLLDYMLVTLRKLTDGLIVYPENMKRNLALSLGLWNSQTVLLALIKKGLTREAAYELTQRNAMQTWQAKHDGRDEADFLAQLRRDPEVTKHFAAGELEKLAGFSFAKCHGHIREGFRPRKSLKWPDENSSRQSADAGHILELQERAALRGQAGFFSAAGLAHRCRHAAP